MTKAKTYYYEVHGMGQFPTDMLRYDRCKIIDTREEENDKVYIIEGKHPPTIGRWLSFMWHVNHVTTVAANRYNG
jgi:hypothetical protein